MRTNLEHYSNIAHLSSIQQFQGISLQKSLEEKSIEHRKRLIVIAFMKKN